MADMAPLRAVWFIQDWSDRLAREIDAWEPAPCPPDFGREPTKRPTPQPDGRWLR